MTDNIQNKAITIKKAVLRFTDSAIRYAWENYDPAQIEEQPDGSLLVTFYGAIECKIVNMVLTECGRVQVVSPPELAEKVVEQAERVIRAHSPNRPDTPNKSEKSTSAYPAYPAYKSYPQHPIIRPGSYENLLTYRKAQVIYDATVLFCQRFLRKGDRTIDQMVQAARSGKQNIVEGAKASGVSTETELKLTGVARASLEELLEDYKDYLRTHDLPLWSKDDKAALAIRRLGRSKNESYETYRLFREAVERHVCQYHDLSDLSVQLSSGSADPESGADFRAERRHQGTDAQGQAGGAEQKGIGMIGRIVQIGSCGCETENHQ